MNPPATPGRSAARMVLVALVLVASTALAGCNGKEGPVMLTAVLTADHWPLGDVVVAGKILNVTRYETPQGPVARLDIALAGTGVDTQAIERSGPESALLAPTLTQKGGAHVYLLQPDGGNYRVGKDYTATVRFTAVQVNGRAGVGSAQLGLVEDIPRDIAAGIHDGNAGRLARLTVASLDLDDWVTYDVTMSEARTVPLADLDVKTYRPPSATNDTDSFPAWVRLWNGVVENVSSLAGGVKKDWVTYGENGLLSALNTTTADVAVVDHDEDGALGTGDQLRFRSDRNGNDYGAVLLDVRDRRADDRSITIAQTFGPQGVLVKETGAFRIDQIVMEKGQDGLYDRFRITATSGKGLNLANITIGLDANGEHNTTTPTMEQPSGKIGNVRYLFQDHDANGRLDAGDNFEFRGLNVTDVAAFTIGTDIGDRQLALRTWIPAFDYDLQAAGLFAFSRNPSHANMATVKMEKPYRAYADESITVVTVRGANDTLVAKVNLRVGDMAVWPDGALFLDDADKDGGMSEGDTLRVESTLERTWKVEFDVYGGYRHTVTLLST